MQIPLNLNVLGLGGYRLQSLSTFHRLVKKLSHFESTQIFTIFCLFYLGFPINQKFENREKKNMAYQDNCIFILESKNMGKLECFYMFRKLDWAL